MTEDLDRDLARLQRIQDARRAGIDIDRDMCTHGYVNGNGCDNCDRYSRRIELALEVGAILLLLAAVIWVGLSTGALPELWHSTWERFR